MGTQTSNSCANIGQMHKLNTKVNKVFTLGKSHVATVIILRWRSGGKEVHQAKQIVFFCCGRCQQEGEERSHMATGTKTNCYVNSCLLMHDL